MYNSFLVSHLKRFFPPATVILYRLFAVEPTTLDGVMWQVYKVPIALRQGVAPAAQVDGADYILVGIETEKAFPPKSSYKLLVGDLGPGTLRSEQRINN